MKNWQELQKQLMKRHRRNTASKSALLMIGGLAAGVAAGLLLAPDNGKQTRNKLSENGRKALESGRAKARRIMAKMSDKMKHNADGTRPNNNHATPMPT